MKIIDTNFKDLKIVKQNTFKDLRGDLRIIFNKKILIKKFVYEYCTTSKKNSLRGFHFQYKFKQAKFVTVLKGKILDCVLDLRKNSKTFGKTFKIILSKENNLALYIPRGFAHAYYSIGNENIIYYKLDNYYKPEYEDGINTTDKKLMIKWPSKTFLRSKKDKNWGYLEEFKKKYKHL